MRKEQDKKAEKVQDQQMIKHQVSIAEEKAMKERSTKKDRNRAYHDDLAD